MDNVKKALEKDNKKNNKVSDPKKRRAKKIIAVCLLMAALLLGAAYWYVSDYYQAGEGALATIENPASGIEVLKDEEAGQLAFLPEESNNLGVGLVFYPGGKVEYSSYAPLMTKLAERGISCYLVRMPFNLAILDKDRADKILSSCENIGRWYIGGHSLGGSAAAMHIKDSMDSYEGLLLLASYSTADLSGMDLKSMSIYGTSDRVLNMDKFEANMGNLPQASCAVVLNGGNHCQFGDYGFQKGDGLAGISAEEQLELSADAIADWVTVE